MGRKIEYIPKPRPTKKKKKKPPKKKVLSKKQKNPLLKEKPKSKVYVGYIGCGANEESSLKEFLQFNSWKEAKMYFNNKSNIVHCSEKNFELATKKLDNLYRLRYHRDP